MKKLISLLLGIAMMMMGASFAEGALVTYFSHAGENYNVGVIEEGNTAKLAKVIAEQTGADLFEIKPEKPYSEADLKWTNPLARCNREKLGKKEVAVAAKVQGWDEYDTVYQRRPDSQRPESKQRGRTGRMGAGQWITCATAVLILLTMKNTKSIIVTARWMKIGSQS
mgnify:CR=1 FL=1